MIFSILIWSLWTLLLLILCLTGNSGAFILLSATVVLFIVSAFINLFRKNKIDIKLSFNSGGEKNQIINGTLCVTNNSFLPVSCLYIKLLCKNSLTGEKAYITERVALNPFKSKKINVSLKSCHCGNITFSADNIKLYDFLLLFRKKVKTKVSGNALVYPKLMSAYISLTNVIGSDDTVGDYSGRKAGFYTGDSFKIDEYNYGDNLKNIHWKLTSKFDRLMVKKQLKETDNNILLLLETTLNTKQPVNVLERLAEMFISLSYSLAQRDIRHNIGWYSQSNKEFYLYKINSADDLIAILSKILSACFVIDNKTAFDYYNENYLDFSYSHTFYVSDTCSNALEKSLITNIICSGKNQDMENENAVLFSPDDKNYISIKI